jgi:hypothetical protein
VGVAEITAERRNIDFGGHWLRIILIILLVGALDGFIRAFLFPSKDEFRKAYAVTMLSGAAQNMTIAATARYLQLLVSCKHFAHDAILLFPAVILRFFVLRRPLIRLHGFLSAIIAVVAIVGIVLFSRGFEAMGKHMSAFLVLFGYYSLLSTRRKV